MTTPGGKRVYLKEILPLEMPMMLQIFPVYGCNFKCEFCIHGLEREKHGYISDKILMDMSLYQKLVRDIKKSGKRLKMLRFAAIGEPLLHPKIADMIYIAKESGIADSVDIVTNGALLTPKLSDALISAGLSRLRISVEGLSAEDYQKHCKGKIDFEKFIDNIAYFYHSKTQTEVYIKIIDYMVKEETAREKFYTIFEPICDSIAIEHLTPTVQEIDYDIISDGMKLEKGQNGEELLDARVCPQGFYMMQVNPDGNVVPCCSMKYPAVMGNVYQESVQEIWQGEKFNQFRRCALVSRKCAGTVCEECTLYKYDLHVEDIIDEVSDILLTKY